MYIFEFRREMAAAASIAGHSDAFPVEDAAKEAVLQCIDGMFISCIEESVECLCKVG